MVCWVFLTQTFSDQQKSNETIEYKIEVNDLVSRVQSHLLDSTVCKDTLAGVVISEGAELPIQSIRKGTIDLFSVSGPSSVVGNIILDSMKIKRKQFPKNKEIDFILSLKKKNAKATYGGEIIVRSITVQAEFDLIALNKIVSCYSALDNAITTARELACKDICPTCWDPVQLKCKITGTPIYKDQLDASIKLEPTPIYKTQMFNCSFCGSDCSPCPGGWTELSRNCPLGPQCGFRRWRNSRASCRTATSIMTAPVGYLIPAPPQ